MTAPVSLGQVLQMLTVAGGTITAVFATGAYVQQLHDDLHAVVTSEQQTDRRGAQIVATLTDIADLLRRCPTMRRSAIDWPGQLASRASGPIVNDPCQ